MSKLYFRIQFASGLSGCWVDTSTVFTSWQEGIKAIELNYTCKQERLYPVFEYELTEGDRVYKNVDELYKELYNAADSTNDIKAVMQA